MDRVRSAFLARLARLLEHRAELFLLVSAELERLLLAQIAVELAAASAAEGLIAWI